MSKKKQPHKTNAVRFLEQKKVSFETEEYSWTEEHVGAKDTAKELGIPENELFKTLVTVGNKTGPVVAVIPGNKELDLKKLAKISGNKKIDMLPMKELEPLTGYIHGGCSPVGMKKQFPTYFAIEGKSLPIIRCSAGMRGLQLSINPIELVKIVGGQFADVTND
ncbi:Cys-tRNA(Pro) deacylase [Vagococcus vulneris]|uniref:Cys-tRNA(Pro)/Cys-tRNA(Cys) deacylase n=1 Tax=Vagococcus vulneris TaxID=1977869 RepID=A0A430A266_9ENTE|nr:Cys-tRNA(Pro) deacylase [Vagococcus vulneris]RSU00515.1 aminoacyl-tRNA deacylase [Vagococcus vulneris]